MQRQYNKYELSFTPPSSRTWRFIYQQCICNNFEVLLQHSTSAHLAQTPLLAFNQKLNRNSAKAQSITSSITSYIIDCMVPFSIVDGNGFRNILKAARYTVPERHQFSEQAIPERYEEMKLSVMKSIHQTTRVAITTDSWTSRANSVLCNSHSPLH